jgi:AAA ATPase domain
MWPIRPSRWVGRERELAVLRTAIEALGHGEGTVVWIEGEPGIGKSTLVAEALARADQPGWDVGWGGADQLTRLPLRVMRDCLQVRLYSRANARKVVEVPTSSHCAMLSHPHIVSPRARRANPVRPANGT